jgi:glutathione synthase/RimK-type ligase-like ATP-grasp enzyme
MTHNLAFLTYHKYPQGAPDDQLSFPRLREHGYTLHTPIWNDPTVDWARFDTIIIRSTWDYFLHPTEFQGWLTRIEQLGVRLLNPLSVVRWNMDKIYLKELATRGYPVIPAEWLSVGDSAVLADILTARGWSEAVVKPTVSGGAYQTWVTRAEEDIAGQQAKLDAQLAQTGVMIQQFLPQIRTDGEWSFHYFNRRFSHAIIKRPQPGDFRIQGGTLEGIPNPPSVLLDQARAVLNCVESTVPLLYARVDGLVIDGRLQLMEIELIEPRLYLAQSEEAAERFADAIHECLV